MIAASPPFPVLFDTARSTTSRITRTTFTTPRITPRTSTTSRTPERMPYHAPMYFSWTDPQDTEAPAAMQGKQDGQGFAPV